MTSLPSPSPPPRRIVHEEVDLLGLMSRPVGPVDLLAMPVCSAESLRTALAHRASSTVQALNERDSQGRNALMLAAGLGREDLVQMLLAAAPPGRSTQALEEDVHGLTALMHAVKAGAPPVVRLLVPRSNPNAQSSMGWTALMLASEHPNEALVPLLLPASVAVLNRRNQAGQTALMLAAHAGQPLNVAALLNAGADAGLRDARGHTALHLAAQNGQAESVALLATSAEHVLLRDAKGSMPLDLALKGHRLAAAAVLIARMPTTTAATALNRAMEQDPTVYGRFEGQFPIENLVTPRTQWGGQQALDLKDVRLRRAAQVGDVDTVRALLAHGADPHRGETGHPLDGLDALTLACLGVDTVQTATVPAPIAAVRNVVRALLDAGASPDGTGAAMTPVLAACQNHRWEVVTDLLDAGASPNAYRHFSAEPEAIERQRMTLLHRFLLHEGDGHRTLPARSPGQRLAVVRSLLDAGVDPNARFNDRHRHREDVSALLLAVEGLAQDLPVIEALLDAGAHPDPWCRWTTVPAVAGRLPSIPNGAGPGPTCVETRWTPLAAAASAGQVEVCRLLVERGARLHHRLDQEAPPRYYKGPSLQGGDPIPREPNGQGVSIVELLHQGGWLSVAAYLENLVLRRTLGDVSGAQPSSGRSRPRL